MNDSDEDCSCWPSIRFRRLGNSYSFGYVFICVLFVFVHLIKNNTVEGPCENIKELNFSF